MLASYARASFRHPWRAVLVCVVVLAAMLAAIGVIGSSFDNQREIPSTESGDGFDILEAHFEEFGSGLTGSIVFEAEAGARDPGVEAAMSALFEDVRAIDDVTLVSPYEPQGFRLVSSAGNAPGTIAYAPITLDPSVDDNESGDIGAEIRALIDDAGLNDTPGLRVEIGGNALAGFEPPEAETIGLAFAIVVLILALGSVVAMGTTVFVAVLGVGAGIGLMILLTNVVQIPDLAPTLGLMIGLGAGIDYALFIVTRYRESRGQGLDPESAGVVALDAAGRSVIFAGMTVVISLLGLSFIGVRFIAGVGLAASVTVAMVVIGSITLLPAVLSLLGERIDVTLWRGIAVAGLVAVALLGVGFGFRPLLVALPIALVVAVLGSIRTRRNPLRRPLAPPAPKPLRQTLWYRLSRTVQNRPWSYAIGGAALLLLLASPVLDLRLGFSDEGNLAEDTSARQAYDLLAEGFGPGANGPVLIVTEVDGPADLEVLNRLSGDLNQAPGVAFASPPQPSSDGGAALLQVQPATAPQDAETEALVNALRDDIVPSAVAGSTLRPLVTGAVAADIDFSDYLGGRLIVFFLAVLTLSFLLLMTVFRSLVVPLKAVIMNMLSIGAAYGVMVMVFQWGWGGWLIGVDSGPIEPFIPMMLFAVVFGLSMDYEVFLLSRIKEEYDRTGDPVNSVADGLAVTARVITAAAAIMVVVFLSFVLEDDRVPKVFGLGLATAVFIDATFVRMLIVPSTMELLGARNWWLPGWLDRLLPNLSIEGARQPEDADG